MRILPAARAAPSSLTIILFVVAAAGCGTTDSPSTSDREGVPEVAGAASGYVEAPDGERIHYLEVGPAAGVSPGGDPPARPAGGEGTGRPSLLFIPGWTLTAEIWEPQLERFGQGYRTVAMDPRAQGRSSRARDGHYAAARAQDIRALVEALELEPVVLVGWSMGATEVVAYLDGFGTDGVAGIVLVDGLAGLDFDPALARAFADWAAGFVHDRRTMTEAFVRGMYRTPQSEEYLAAVVEQSLRTPTDAAAALVIGQMRSDFRSTLSRIDRPTLIAIAPGGPWTELYLAMADSIPAARLEAFEGAGHALFVDRAARFNELLEEFLAELEVSLTELEARPAP